MYKRGKNVRYQRVLRTCLETLRECSKKIRYIRDCEIVQFTNDVKSIYSIIEKNKRK